MTYEERIRESIEKTEKNADFPPFRLDTAFKMLYTPTHMSMGGEGRLTAFDMAKGIGIILAILGHSGIAGAKCIYSFHMPLFFIISG